MFICMSNIKYTMKNCYLTDCLCFSELFLCSLLCYVKIGYTYSLGYKTNGSQDHALLRLPCVSLLSKVPLLCFPSFFLHPHHGTPADSFVEAAAV